MQIRAEFASSHSRPAPPPQERERGEGGGGAASSSSEMSDRPYLRARRRVRQRVDAGEPRNSYSSIPGFSFRSAHNSYPRINPAHFQQHHQYGLHPHHLIRPPPPPPLPLHHHHRAFDESARQHFNNGHHHNSSSPSPSALNISASNEMDLRARSTSSERDESSSAPEGGRGGGPFRSNVQQGQPQQQQRQQRLNSHSEQQGQVAAATPSQFGEGDASEVSSQHPQRDRDHSEMRQPAPPPPPPLHPYPGLQHGQQRHPYAMNGHPQRLFGPLNPYFQQQPPQHQQPGFPAGASAAGMAAAACAAAAAMHRAQILLRSQQQMQQQQQQQQERLHQVACHAQGGGESESKTASIRELEDESSQSVTKKSVIPDQPKTSQNDSRKAGKSEDHSNGESRGDSPSEERAGIAGDDDEDGRRAEGEDEGDAGTKKKEGKERNKNSGEEGEGKEEATDFAAPKAVGSEGEEADAKGAEGKDGEEEGKEPFSDGGGGDDGGGDGGGGGGDLGKGKEGEDQGADVSKKGEGEGERRRAGEGGGGEVEEEEVFRDASSKETDVVAEEVQVVATGNEQSNNRAEQRPLIQEKALVPRDNPVNKVANNPFGFYHPGQYFANFRRGVFGGSEQHQQQQQQQPPRYPFLAPKPFSRFPYPPLHQHLPFQQQQQPRQPLPPFHHHHHLQYRLNLLQQQQHLQQQQQQQVPHGGNVQLMLRDLLNGKLALAAAVAQRQYFSEGQAKQQEGPESKTDSSESGKMEHPALGVITNGHSGRDLIGGNVRHNNNDQLDKEKAAASLMSHLIKEMIKSKSGQADNEVRTEEDAPMDLGGKDKNDNNKTSEDRAPSAAESELMLKSPRSPSSDAGASSSSGKESKSARLESIVNSMRSSPLPAAPNAVNGCKKRKLYQPQQAGRSQSPVEGEEGKAEEEEEIEDVEEKEDGPTEEKKTRREEEEANHLRTMHEQIMRLQQQQQKAKMMQNDENADPVTKDEVSITRQHPQQTPPQPPPINMRAKPKNPPGPYNNPFFAAAAAAGFPGLPGAPPAAGFPPHHMRENMNPVLLQQVEALRRMQEQQQDKLTKEAITKEIIADTIGNNSEIVDKLVAISPELKGLADILKSEISASLHVIIDSIVGKFLQNRRQQNQQQQQSLKPFSFDDPLGLKQHGEQLNRGLLDTALPPRSLATPPSPPLSLGRGHSGRAPQVRDRAAPRISAHPVSMGSGSPLAPLSQSINTTATNRPPSVALTSSSSVASDKERNIANASPGSDAGSDVNANQEQDEALSLVVTPKKQKRNKVTDSRIKSQQQQSLAEMAKSLAAFPGGGHAAAAAASSALAAAAAASKEGKSPAGGVPPPPPHLFPGVHPGLLPPGLPNLHEFNPFSPLYNQAAVAAAAAAAAAATSPRTATTAAAAAAAASPPPPPPQEKRCRDRTSCRDTRSSAASLDRTSSPGGAPSLIPRTGILSSSSPDFAARFRDGDDFDGDVAYSLGYGLGGEACSTQLTPMHLRKAKLMFFWVRYPSSAIIKMYFPDIKFNKNNTAQLVKWFSNFREFYYIQMEKYARQALSDGITNEQDISVSVDSELYRVLNLHYNRNNHIEVPEHFLPVVQATLREFFLSVRQGKDQESSWKKQIYKIIQRYDEPIPEYFKTQEFLKQLE